MNGKNYFKVIQMEEFVTKFDELIAAKKKFFGYYHGDYNEKTGESWCSDCDIAKPIVEDAVKNLEGADVEFIKFPIARAEWKKSNSLYRTYPKVKLQKVPTLIYYENGVEYGRLTETELFDAKNVEEFFKQAL